MKIMLYVGDEGFADTDFRDGDIFSVHPDTWEPGAKEKERYCVIQTDEYPSSWAELVTSEYAAGPGTENVVRRMRKYRVNYATKLDAETLAAVRDKTVSVDVIVGVFTITDISRK